MTAIIKMNRNRQVNLPSAFIAELNLGEDNYLKAEVKGNHIILTPIDPVERVFSGKDLDLIEETYQREKGAAKPVTGAWTKKAYRSK